MQRIGLLKTKWLYYPIHMIQWETSKVHMIYIRHDQNDMIKLPGYNLLLADWICNIFHLILAVTLVKFDHSRFGLPKSEKRVLTVGFPW